jgi:hypothetical protein
MIKNLYEEYQFKITLNDTKPQIWRRIVVPSTYSFWDLHVAIQDSMGWLDYHLHEFEIINPKTDLKVNIGIPDEEYSDRKILYDHKEKISGYFNMDNRISIYEYDFGDSWRHTVKLEKILKAIIGEKYPKCVAGKRACPPEDCGGIDGYRNLLKILKNPKNEEYEEMVEWTGGDYDPEEFDPREVIFDDPIERLKKSKL